jgi:hypothetical protein
VSAQLPRCLLWPALAAIAAGAVAAAVLAPSAGAATRQPARTPAQPAASARPLLLINGERVTVTTPPGGVRVARVLAAEHPSSTVSFTLGGRSYLVPAADLPELGRSLNLSAPATGGATDKLTVTGTDLSGQADSGDSVFVYNIDDSRRFAGQGTFTGGTATFHVPAGHYWALAIFMVHTTTGWQQRVVTLPQFTVSGATTEHLAARSASSEVAMTTPRPATAEDSTFEVRRPGPAGPVQYWEFNDVGISLWVSPTTTRPTVGRLQTFSGQLLVSPPHAAGGRYEYDLAYAGPGGVIPRQHVVVRAASLATVAARYVQGVASAGAQSRFGLFGPQENDVLIESVNPFSLPRRQTEYMTGNPAVAWFSQISQGYGSATVVGGQFEGPRRFRAGQHLTDDWNAYPLHPAPNVNLMGAASPRPVVASASRSGNRLTLDMTPFSDSQPGHAGAGFTSASYLLDQNGHQLAAGHLGATNPLAAADDVRVKATVTTRPATLRFTLTARRTGSASPLSARTSTVWTWRSAPRPGAELPAGWRCNFPAADIGQVIKPVRRCAVQPLLTLDYAVRGLTLDGAAPAGRQALTITVGHLPLARAGRITGLTCRVSASGGTTWRRAVVTRHAGGTFTAAYAATAGQKVTLRVRATDASGGSIEETIYGGYQIGG